MSYSTWPVAVLFALVLEGIALCQGGLPEGFPPPSEPSESLRGIELSDPDLEVTLFAAEPLVRDPIAVAWDEHCQMYVVEMSDYPLGPPGGRIRLLLDSDRDGYPDKSVVFAEGIGFPTGVFPWRGGVFVTAAPYILYLRDTDGDGHADDRRIVFQGFVEGNQQHRVNGLIWGPDGWIWGANGDSGGQVFRPENPEQRVNISGSDFRFDPLNLEFEPVAGQSQYGHTFDEFGHRFTCNNSDHIRLVVFDRRCLELNPYVSIPFVQRSIADHGGKGAIYPVSPQGPRFNMPLDLGRFSAACSVYVYRGGLLPERYRGNSFTCDAVGNIVHRDLLFWDGGHAVARRAATEQNREFFAARDPWVRPVYVTTGPDGALYVCDMYRAVIEHPEWIPDSIERELDLYAGSDRGRIYRIAPRGVKPQRPDPMDVAADALVRGLCSQNAWVRDTAYRLIVENMEQLDSARLESELTAAFNAASRATTKLLLARVLFRCGFRGATRTVGILVRNSDPRIRAAALRLARDYWAAFDQAELLEHAARGVRDEDAEVQKEAACLLGQLGGDDGRVVDLLAYLLETRADDAEVRTAALLASREREDAVLARLARTSGSVYEGAIEQLAYAAARREKAQDCLEAAREFIERGQTGPALTVLAGLARGGVRVGSSARYSDLLEMVRRIAFGERATIPERRRALGALRLWGSAAVSQDDLRRLLASDLAPEVRQVTVELAWETGAKSVVEALLRRWNEHTPELRRTLVRVCRSSVEGQSLLVRLAQEGVIPPGELVALWPEVRERLADVVKLQGRDEVLRRYAAALELPGDRARGKKLFEQHCAKCHPVEGVGANVGPDLVRTRTRAPEALLVDILDPNRAVDPAYINHVVVTKDGRVFQGIVVADTAASITLRAAEGEQQTIPREDVEAVRSTGQSLMPEGLEEQLSVQDVADLIRYLREIQ